ncbi:hypothetical protein BJ322DRAFT_1222067 [Thelephora terrestris]|uniref:Fucose-specific lectin n=1 Tax=Thelephora terrestris TaxID=56493 RepID=A0A9P6L0K7_9AGAM|nr:hypothetical protein BJ322DRAFT_1222067 [Thelephora terrestris]
MSLDGPITGTGISVITDRQWSLGIFFQLLDGQLDLVKHKDGVWAPGEHLAAKPVDASPFASITYNGGKEVRVYYIDTEYVLQEYCHTDGKGWYPGEIGLLRAKVTPGSGLAAIVYGPLELGGGEEPGDHIRVYYQEAGSHTVKELANDGHWHTGDLNITHAFGGTSLAAVTYYFDRQTQIRVYYQDQNLGLKEHGHNGSGWFEGGFNPGPAAAQTPLAALAFGGVELQVYWRDLYGRIVFDRNTGSWGGAKAIEPIGPGYRLAALQWDNGKYLRVYYQLFDRALVEFYSDDGGHTWSQSKSHLKGST